MNINEEIWIEMLNKNIINKQEKDSLKKLFKYYHIGEYIYPNVIKRKIIGSPSQTFDILDFLERKNILEKVFRLYCSDCEEYTGQFLNIKDIQNNQISYCESCDKELIFEKNSRIFFKTVGGE